MNPPNKITIITAMVILLAFIILGFGFQSINILHVISNASI